MTKAQKKKIEKLAVILAGTLADPPGKGRDISGWLLWLSTVFADAYEAVYAVQEARRDEEL